MSKPYLFLLTLFIVLVFIVGVRYGQYVEKTNKIINYTLSITPTKPPTPTPTWVFEEYKSKKWGVKFSYPSFLEIKEATNETKIIIDLK